MSAVHGNWGTWSVWGTCSVTCGTGLMRRDRNCDNPYPSPDGNPCFGDPLNYDICNEQPCSSKLESFRPLLHGCVMITDGHPSSETFPLKKRMVLIT